MLKQVLKSAGARRAGARLIGAYLRFALRTTRWTIEGEANLAPFVPNTPVVVAFWHECLPLMPALWLRVRGANHERRATMLVSRHADGMLIGDALSGFGLATVHGSTARSSADGGRTGDKGGAAALAALLRVLRRGDAVVITPDGPVGPAREAAQGSLYLAARSGAPVLPAAARVRFRRTLSSWDRMILPLPFGRGALVCLAPIVVERHAAPVALATLTAALTAAADRAEALCR
jgi:lysophospholipid acyltransferase (LPLAT)-like uncharacterized protein